MLIFTKKDQNCNIKGTFKVLRIGKTHLRYQKIGRTFRLSKIGRILKVSKLEGTFRVSKNLKDIQGIELERHSVCQKIGGTLMCQKIRDAR